MLLHVEMSQCVRGARAHLLMKEMNLGSQGGASGCRYAKPCLLLHACNRQLP